MNLNLGCGPNPLEGYINVDIGRDTKADVYWDLESGLGIFPDNSADIIWANMVLEHVKNYEHLMHEIHRVLKHGGKFCANVPDSNGSNAWGHPGHLRGFNITSFKYWIRDTAEYRAYRPGIEFETIKYITTGEVISVVLSAVKELPK